MSQSTTVVVLHGGVSKEREVSLRSGSAVALAAAMRFPTRLVRVDSAALPSGIDAANEIVLSSLHGTFGEDGALQQLMDAAGIEYAGCGAAASALTMDKARTKAAAAASGVRVARGLVFDGANRPTADAVVKALGASVVLKPNCEGSSVGLRFCASQEEIAAALGEITSGSWLLEERIVGRELTVGLLRGKAMGVVEIVPRTGAYDYTSKYTKGASEYFAPARISEVATQRVQAFAEAAFKACDCRDFARIDFILTSEDSPVFLEINTLPGMTETSLLPMSARCVGHDYGALVGEMASLAIERLRAKQQKAQK